jgi:hypothetical protein
MDQSRLASSLADVLENTRNVNSVKVVVPLNALWIEVEHNLDHHSKCCPFLLA